MKELCIFKWVEGETLGDTFLLRERLGKGTYGVVGKAIRLKDGPYKKRGDVVALKVPFDQEIGEDNLRREPEIIQQFKHENIVKVFGYHTVSGFFVIEMELIEGHNLADILDNQNCTNRYTLHTALGWIRQIILGLQSMKQFSHGDIKPQNILIRSDGVAKLVDFGASRRLEDAWVYTRGQGTEQYMAPEVALDNRRIPVKSDLYSVGVVLYEMATGDVPFQSNFERLQGKELTKPREINSSIPINLERLVLKCLERDPDRRYSSWEIFLKRLDEIIRPIHEEEQTDTVISKTHRYEFKPETSSPLYYLDKAKKAMLRDEYEEAVRHAESAVASSEEHPTYLRMLAAFCLKSEYYEKAKTAFLKLLAKYDNGYPVEIDQLAYVMKKLAELHIKTHDYEIAVQMWKRFLEVSEDKSLAKFKLAITYGLNGEYKKAISFLEEVRTECPDAVVVYSKLGWAYSLAGDSRQALSYYNQALIIDPADLFSLFELGKYYRIRGDYRRANKYFDQIKKYDRMGEYAEKINRLFEVSEW